MNVLSTMLDCAVWIARAGDGERGEELEKSRDTVGELIEAARRVLDKEWEYGEEQPHCARLNDLIDKASGVCE